MMTQRTSKRKSAHTVLLCAGGALRIGSALLPENSQQLLATSSEGLRFRVGWRNNRLYLTPVRSGGVVAFVTNPQTRSPRVSLASALRMHGVNWRDLPQGPRPAVRRGKTIVVSFEAENGHKT